MMTEHDFERMLTIGDLLRHPDLQRFTRRQLDYALERGGIAPIGRMGIVRVFSIDQIDEIAEVLGRTTHQGGCITGLRRKLGQEDSAQVEGKLMPELDDEGHS